MNETTYIDKAHVQELNEMYGYFKFGDAQGDVSLAFANAVIANYLSKLHSAPKTMTEDEARKLLNEYDKEPEEMFLTMLSVLSEKPAPSKPMSFEEFHETIRQSIKQAEHGPYLDGEKLRARLDLLPLQHLFGGDVPGHRRQKRYVPRSLPT